MLCKCNSIWNPPRPVVIRSYREAKQQFSFVIIARGVRASESWDLRFLHKNKLLRWQNWKNIQLEVYRGLRPWFYSSARLNLASPLAQQTPNIKPNSGPNQNQSNCKRTDHKSKIQEIYFIIVLCNENRGELHLIGLYANQIPSIIVVQVFPP